MITISAEPRRWTLTIKKGELFARVSNESIYINNRLPESLKNPANEILEGDKPQFDRYYRRAISNTLVVLARYLDTEITPSSISEDGDLRLDIIPKLDMRDTIAFSIDGYVMEYCEKIILKYWFGHVNSIALGIEKECSEVLENLTSALHYRKKPVSLPIHPVL